jgi:hypothetical protein
MFTLRLSGIRRSCLSSMLWAVAFAVSSTAVIAAEVAPPDVRGTWKGNSETILLGTGNPHHIPGQPAAPEMRSVPFTLTIDKQDGRRFSGTFSSPRSTENIVAVFSRDGTLYLVDDEGYTHGTMLAPDRMELCYMFVAPGGASRIASCADMKKQP